MFSTVETILPIFLLILFGWLLKRIVFLDDKAWAALERLTYFILFPALLITTLAGASFAEMEVGGVAAAIAGAILVVSLFLLVTKPLLDVDDPGFTSVYQGSVRMNTYIGLSVAARVFGPEGLAAAALAIAIIVPLVNLTCVTMLSRYGTRAASGQRVLVACVTNPLIIASVIGLALNVGGVGTPPLLGPMAEILGKAALPLGLLAVGAGLQVAALQSAGVTVVFTSIVKLVALPALTYFFLRGLEIQGMEAGVAILFNSLPTATSAYILASQFGGDARLMAALITVETLLSMVTLPVVLWMIA